MELFKSFIYTQFQKQRPFSFYIFTYSLIVKILNKRCKISLRIQIKLYHDFFMIWHVWLPNFTVFTTQDVLFFPPDTTISKFSIPRANLAVGNSLALRETAVHRSTPTEIRSFHLSVYVKSLAYYFEWDGKEGILKKNAVIRLQFNFY